VGRERKKRKVVHPAPQFFLYFFEYLGIITYIGNHGDRGEYGSEKQFNNSCMLPLGHTVPQFDVSFPEKFA